MSTFPTSRDDLTPLRHLLTIADTAAPDSYWRDRARCEGFAGAMFPEPGDSRGTREAKAVCSGCPVKAACLASAIKLEESAPPKTRHGVLGGATAEERWRLYLERSGVSAPLNRPRTGGGKESSECGTEGAYERHRRNGEAIDGLCAEWRARRDGEVAERRARREAADMARKAAKEAARPKCGTVDGYVYHRHHRQRVCEPCREAYATARANGMPSVKVKKSVDVERLLEVAQASLKA